MLFSRRPAARRTAGLFSLLLAVVTVGSSLRREFGYAAPGYARNRLLMGMGIFKSYGDTKTSKKESAHKTDNKESVPGHEDSEVRNPSDSKEVDNIYSKGTKSKDKSKGESEDGSEEKSKASTKGESKGASKGESKGKGSSPGEPKSKSDSKTKPSSKPTRNPTSKTTPSPASKPTGSRDGGDPVPEQTKDSTKPTMDPTEKDNTDVSVDDEPSNNVPTKSPIPTKTPMPTKTPVPTSISKCDLELNGSFGITSVGRQELNFIYQIETTSNVTQDILDGALLPLVERAVGSRLLSLLFVSCEGTSSRILQGKEPSAAPSQGKEPSAAPSQGKELSAAPSQGEELSAAPSKRQEPTAAPSDVQGYSSLPIDRMLPGVSCFGSREAPANTCYVIEGGSRVYSAEGVDFEAIRARAKDSIKAAMESGTLNNLEERIVNITFLENATFDEDPDTQSDIPSTGGDSETLPAWALGITGGGIFVFLLLFGFLCVRRQRKDRGIGKMTPLGDNEIDYLPLPSFEHECPYYDEVPLVISPMEPVPHDYIPQFTPPPALDERSGDEDDEDTHSS